MKRALVRLHGAGFVHGDVRDVNVLIRNDGAPAGCADVLVVDWDWAGREGEAKYPLGINTRLSRPEGVFPAMEIKAEHDVWMAEHLVDSVYLEL